jgi:CDP-diacylglycerol---serine O-phosphatidyltransferase
MKKSRLASPIAPVLAHAHQPSMWLRALPHMVTMAALVAGLTSVTFALEGQLPRAIGCILLACILDACDGRVARWTGTNSQFGAELDSLADVICFGAVPALVLYLWGLTEFGWLGWSVCVTLTCSTALRLARFNVAVRDTTRPSWSAAFFQGIPAPAGAFLALLPIYLEYSTVASTDHSRLIALVWLPIVASLMVSTLPTFSGKLLGRVLTRAWVLLLLAAMGTICIFAIWGIWIAMVVLCVAYLAMLPLSMWRFMVLTGRG